MDNPTFLSLSGLDAITGMVAEALGPDSVLALLLAQWTKPTANPQLGTITYTSQAFSTGSLVGQYTGQMTFAYQARSLGTLLPIPLVYRDPYPTTFIRLQAYFKDRYNIQLDDGEFALAGDASLTPLAGTSPIHATLDPVSGLIGLTALSSSIRFVPNTTFRILPTHPSVPVPLARLVSLDGAIRVAKLTDTLA